MSVASMVIGWWCVFVVAMGLICEFTGVYNKWSDTRKMRFQIEMGCYLIAAAICFK